MKPHWAWFLLSPVILLLGGGISIAALVSSMVGIRDGMQVAEAPGTTTVRLEAGSQPIHYEQRGGMAPAVPPGLAFTITPAAGGAPVSATPTSANFTYTAEGYAGRRWGEAEIPADGDYVVMCIAPEGAAPGRLSIGGNPGEKLAFGLVTFFGAGGLSFVLSVAVLLFVLVKRMRSRKNMPPQPYVPYPQPPA